MPLLKAPDLMRELATFIDAGVPLSDGLGRLLPHLPANLRKSVRSWKERLDCGLPLSQAMVECECLLGPGALAMIEAGEASGRLSESLRVIARESELRARRISRLTTASIYPLILIHAAAFIPALGQAYQSGPIAAVVSILAVLGPLYAAGLLVVLAAWMRRRSSGLARTIDRAQMTIPFLGRCLRGLALARWSRILAALMDAGVRWEEALARAASACGNSVVAAALGDRSESLLQGRTITQILQDAGVAPDSMVAVIQTGETSGTLPRTLRENAERLDFETEQGLDRITAAVPLAFYLLGVVLVLLQMMRILSPILQSYQELLP